MQTETLYKIRISRITYLIGQVIFLKVIQLLSKKITCPFKKIFHIPCPLCGMTRSFYALTNFKIKESLEYNFLLLPLLITIFVIDIIFLYEIIKNKKILPTIKITYNKIIIVIILIILSIIWGITHRI